MSRIFFQALAWCLALMLMVAGCVLKPLPEGLPGTGIPQDGVSQTIPFITGQLVDASGRPVEGAAVRAYVAPYRIEGLSSAPVTSVETSTDARGAFKLVSPPLGSVAVEARGLGQKALRTGVTVASGARVELGTLALQPTGRIVGRVKVASGISLLGTDVFIPGTDYLAKTAANGAFAIQDVPVGTYPLAAVRQSFQPRVLEGVQVLAGQTTTAPDLELSLDAPVLASLNPLNGGPGTVVTLRGSNFGESSHTSFQVTFGDALATTVKRLSDTEIQATVPMGAASGGVVVRSKGIASEARPFQILARLSLAPSSVGIYPGETFPFTLRAYDDRDNEVATPSVQWALGDPSLGTVSAQGTFQGNGEGVTGLEARSGLLVSTAWVGVSRYRATTFAGDGVRAHAGDGGSAQLASFRMPYALASDASGSLYVCDGSRTVIRRISPEGIVTRFAGLGTDHVPSGDGGPALEANLGEFASIAIDADNRLWLSSANHHVIRLIPLDDRRPPFRAGYIYHAAGTGSAGYSGSDRPGTEAALNYPGRLIAAAAGSYFADRENQRIRLITPDLRVLDVLGTGLGSLLSAPAPEAAANIANPLDCAMDDRGNMVIGCSQQLLFWCRVTGTYFGRPMQAGWVYPLAGVVAQRAFAGDGPLAPGLVLGNTPQGFFFDPDGGCWFVENHLVRRLTPQGRIETLAGKALEAAHRQAFGFDGEGRNALASSIGGGKDLLVLGNRILLADSPYGRIRLLQPMD